MASPDQEFSRLLERYFDGTLSAEERTVMEQRLRTDATARRAHWEAARWNATLSTWGEQHAGRQEAKLVAFPAASPPLRASRRIWLMRTIAAAAAVILGFFAFRVLRPGSEAVLAEVSFQRDAALPRALRAGDYTISAGA